MPVEDFHRWYRRISLTEYRRHLPTAMLMSQLLNALGGKGDDSTKSMPAHKRFEAEELLPGYARPEALTRDLPLTPEQCKAVMEGIAAREIPSWAVQVLNTIMPISQVMRHGGGSRKSESEDEFEDEFEDE